MSILCIITSLSGKGVGGGRNSQGWLKPLWDGCTYWLDWAREHGRETTNTTRASFVQLGVTSQAVWQVFSFYYVVVSDCKETLAQAGSWWTVQPWSFLPQICCSCMQSTYCHCSPPLYSGACLIILYASLYSCWFHPDWSVHSRWALCNQTKNISGPPAAWLPLHPQVDCQRNCSYLCHRKGGVHSNVWQKINIKSNPVELQIVSANKNIYFNVYYKGGWHTCFSRPAFCCPRRLVAGAWDKNWAQTSFRFFIADAQVLLPESFLEEFYSAVSSLEGYTNFQRKSVIQARIYNPKHLAKGSSCQWVCACPPPTNMTPVIILDLK